MVYLPGNEAARTVMNWNKWRSQLSRDEIAEYLTKTDHKKCKNTQNIHIARWALNLSTFWGVSSRKKNIFLYPEIGQSFEESTRGDKLECQVLTCRYIYWIRLLYDVRNYSDLGGCYPPLPDNILLDLHNLFFTSYSVQLKPLFCKIFSGFFFKIMIVPGSMDLMIWFKLNPAPLITMCCLRSFNILHWRTDSVTLTPVWYD